MTDINDPHPLGTRPVSPRLRDLAGRLPVAVRALASARGVAQARATADRLRRAGMLRDEARRDVDRLLR